jgi:hypothetical protein
MIKIFIRRIGTKEEEEESSSLFPSQDLLC